MGALNGDSQLEKLSDARVNTAVLVAVGAVGEGAADGGLTGVMAVALAEPAGVKGAGD